MSAMTNKETARQQVAAVVETFRKTPKKTRESFNEDQTRHTFILPLFRALGWSTVDPTEFSAEEQISRGFVDFGFYLNGVPVFYLETKRVKEDISKPEHMKQAINYAYLKGVTWAVLTDFEETMVFNAEWEERDPEQARFLTLRWDDYADGHFDDLWLLSKPSMQQGEINEKAERYGRKRRKEPVTDKLFKQLTEWRRELFSVIQTYNAEKLWAQNPHEIDNAVQKLIDRLIFIRTAEDREIEPNRLQALVRQSKPGDLWQKLLALFRELDGVYNSNLFAQSALDWMDVYDPDLIKEIIEGLYAPHGSYFRYDFNAISADVLGAVYEQYLGFKALDPEGKTSLAGVASGKQQKRKAQGIYYTPQFVVRYIVQNTVGRLLEEGADAHKLRILDPACGSGSFLIEAFDVLDLWLRQHEPDVPASERRRRILTENIYGVDLDDQAVEVTRLNLLLRASLERGKLPLLTNIQHGNSLVSDAAVAGETAFVWEERFADVMRGGGFDVVIGNPPWGATTSSIEENHFKDTYETASGGNHDTYILFIERALQMLRNEGVFSFITPDTFLRKNNFLPTRRFILEKSTVVELVETGPVFSKVRDTWCLIFTLRNAPVSATSSVKHKQINRFVVSAEERLSQFGREEWDRMSDVPQSIWLQKPNMVIGYLISSAEQAVIEKLERNPRLKQLREKFTISRGEEGSNVLHP